MLLINKNTYDIKSPNYTWLLFYKRKNQRSGYCCLNVTSQKHRVSEAPYPKGIRSAAPYNYAPFKEGAGVQVGASFASSATKRNYFEVSVEALGNKENFVSSVKKRKTIVQYLLSRLLHSNTGLSNQQDQSHMWVGKNRPNGLEMSTLKGSNSKAKVSARVEASIGKKLENKIIVKRKLQRKGAERTSLGFLSNFFPYNKSFLCYWLLPFVGFVFSVNKETNINFNTVFSQNNNFIVDFSTQLTGRAPLNNERNNIKLEQIDQLKNKQELALLVTTDSDGESASFLPLWDQGTNRALRAPSNIEQSAEVLKKKERALAIDLANQSHKGSVASYANINEALPLNPYFEGVSRGRTFRGSEVGGSSENSAISYLLPTTKSNNNIENKMKEYSYLYLNSLESYIRFRKDKNLSLVHSLYSERAKLVNSLSEQTPLLFLLLKNQQLTSFNNTGDNQSKGGFKGYGSKSLWVNLMSASPLIPSNLESPTPSAGGVFDFFNKFVFSTKLSLFSGAPAQRAAPSNLFRVRRFAKSTKTSVFSYNENEKNQSIWPNITYKEKALTSFSETSESTFVNLLENKSATFLSKGASIMNLNKKRVRCLQAFFMVPSNNKSNDFSPTNLLPLPTVSSNEALDLGAKRKESFVNNTMEQRNPTYLKNPVGCFLKSSFLLDEFTKKELTKSTSKARFASLVLSTKLPNNSFYLKQKIKEGFRVAAWHSSQSEAEQPSIWLLRDAKGVVRTSLGEQPILSEWSKVFKNNSQESASASASAEENRKLCLKEGSSFIGESVAKCSKEKLYKLLFNSLNTSFGVIKEKRSVVKKLAPGSKSAGLLKESNTSNAQVFSGPDKGNASEENILLYLPKNKKLSHTILMTSHFSSFQNKYYKKLHNILPALQGSMKNLRSNPIVSPASPSAPNIVKNNANLTNTSIKPVIVENYLNNFSLFSNLSLPTNITKLNSEASDSSARIASFYSQGNSPAKGKKMEGESLVTQSKQDKGVRGNVTQKKGFLNQQKSDLREKKENKNEFLHYSNFIQAYKVKLKNLLLINQLKSSSILKNSFDNFNKEKVRNTKIEKLLRTYFSIKNKNTDGTNKNIKNTFSKASFSQKVEFYNKLKNQLNSIFTNNATFLLNPSLIPSRVIKVSETTTPFSSKRRNQSDKTPRLLIQNRAFILNSKARITNTPNNLPRSLSGNDSNLLLKKELLLSEAAAHKVQGEINNMGEEATLQTDASYYSSPYVISAPIGIEGVKRSVESFTTEEEATTMIEKQRKYIQKKRRRKKIKKETRRRKKRKRFYPRPIWLRYRLFLRFVNKRNKDVSNTRNTSFATKTNLNKNIPFIEVKKAVDVLKQKNNITRHVGYTLGNNKQSPLSLKKENFTFFSTPFSVGNQAMLGDFKKLLWKSYWLRSNLNPYLKRVKSFLIQMKERSQKWELIKDFKSLLNSIGGFSFNDVVYETTPFLPLTSHSGQKQKGTAQTYFALLHSSPSRAFSQNISNSSVTPFSPLGAGGEQAVASPEVEAIRSSLIPSSHKVSSEKELLGRKGKSATHLPRDEGRRAYLIENPWENTLYFAEYNRITYDRIQEFLSQIRENFATLALLSNSAVSPPIYSDGVSRAEEEGKDVGSDRDRDRDGSGDKVKKTHLHPYFGQSTKESLTIGEEEAKNEANKVKKSLLQKVRSSHISHSKIQYNKREEILSKRKTTDFWVKLGKTLMAENQNTSPIGLKFSENNKKTYFNINKKAFPNLVDKVIPSITKQGASSLGISLGKEKPTKAQLRILWSLSKTTPTLTLESAADGLSNIDPNSKTKQNHGSYLYKRKQTWVASPESGKYREQTKYNKTKKMVRDLSLKIQTFLNEQVDLISLQDKMTILPYLNNFSLLINSDNPNELKKTQNFAVVVSSPQSQPHNLDENTVSVVPALLTPYFVRGGARSETTPLQKSQERIASIASDASNTSRANQQIQLYSKLFKKVRQKEEKYEFLNKRNQTLFLTKRQMREIKKALVFQNPTPFTNLFHTPPLDGEALPYLTKLSPVGKLGSEAFAKDKQKQNEIWLTSLTNKSSYWWQSPVWLFPLASNSPVLKGGSFAGGSLSDSSVTSLGTLLGTGTKNNVLMNQNNPVFFNTVFISTLLFYFCTIIGLLSISQIRSLLKFYLLGISKVYKISLGILKASYNSFSSSLALRPAPPLNSVPQSSNKVVTRKDKRIGSFPAALPSRLLFKSPQGAGSKEKGVLHGTSKASEASKALFNNKGLTNKVNSFFETRNLNEEQAYLILDAIIGNSLNKSTSVNLIKYYLKKDKNFTNLFSSARQVLSNTTIPSVSEPQRNSTARNIEEPYTVDLGRGASFASPEVGYSKKVFKKEAFVRKVGIPQLTNLDPTRTLKRLEGSRDSLNDVNESGSKIKTVRRQSAFLKNYEKTNQSFLALKLVSFEQQKLFKKELFLTSQLINEEGRSTTSLVKQTTLDLLFSIIKTAIFQNKVLGENKKTERLSPLVSESLLVPQSGKKVLEVGRNTSTATGQKKDMFIQESSLKNLTTSKNKYKITLSNLVLLNYVINYCYILNLGAKQVVKQSFDILGRFGPKSIFNFLEKPGELIIDWIAYMFLVEWSSHMTNTIPENVDLYLGTSYYKLTRNLHGLNLLSIMSSNDLFIQNNKNVPFLWNNGFSPRTLFNSFSGEGGKNARESFATSTSIKTDLSILNFGSTFIQNRIYHLYEILLFQFYQPDTDLIVRQRKGTIFWDVWGDFLMQVAEDSNINISELTSLKEEQIKLLGLLEKNELLFKNQSTVGNNLEKGLTSIGKSAPRAGTVLQKPNKVLKYGHNKFIANLQKLKLNKNINQASYTNFLLDKIRVADEVSSTYESSHNSHFYPGGLEESLTNSLGKNKLQSFTLPSGAQQFLSYEGKDTELFIDLHPPKSFSSISLLKKNESVQTSLGSLVCQIFSGIMSKQISKNILMVAFASCTKNNTSHSVSDHEAPSSRRNSEAATVQSIVGSVTQQNEVIKMDGFIGSQHNNQHDKTLLIQAIAGETELKIITDNAYRYAMVYRGVAVGIKLLRDVFDSLCLHTPCLFLMEDIHAIGERRPLLISDDEKGASPNGKPIFGSQREEIHEKNQVLYQLSKHVISHYGKPYKGDFSLLIPTNHFCFDLFSPISNFTNSLNMSSLPAPKIYIKSSDNNSSLSNQNETGNGGDSQSPSQKIKKSRLLIKSSQIFSPPATSPFSVLTLKEDKKFKPYKIVSEMPWGGLPGEELAQLSKASYSIRVKVAVLADMAISTLSVKLDMITDLLVIIDSVKGNRGFVVFATTHVPSILDPALRRPGRFDETITLGLFPNLLSRWHILKSSSGLFIAGKTSSFTTLATSSLKKGISVDLTYLIRPSSLSSFSEASISNVYARMSLLSSASNRNKINNTHKFDFTPVSNAILLKQNLSFHNFSLYLSDKNQSPFVGFNSELPFNVPKEKSKAWSEENQANFCNSTNNLVQFTKFNQMVSSLAYSFGSETASLFEASGAVLRLGTGQEKGLTTYGTSDPSFIMSNQVTDNRKKEISKQIYLNNKKRIKMLSHTYFIASRMCYEASGANFASSYPGSNSEMTSKQKSNFIDFLQPLNMETSPFYISLYASTNQFKNHMIKHISSKIAEMILLGKVSNPFYSTLKPLNSGNQASIASIPRNISNVSGAKSLKQSTAFLFKNGAISKHKYNVNEFTSFGLSKTWGVLSSLIISFVQKRYLLNNNLMVSKFLNFNNKNALYEAPSPPSSNILLPARRYENYKRSFAFFSGRKVSTNIMDKIQSHQQQRLVKRLYGFPVQEQFRSEVRSNALPKLANFTAIQQPHLNAVSLQAKQGQMLESNKVAGIASLTSNNFSEKLNTRNSNQHNNVTTFTNATLMIGSLMSDLQKPSNSNWFVKNRILTRHKNYLTNQWWNGQLPEHNAETTYLSDIDWRYSFIESIGDLLLDFPDADQHYNPRNRRWLLTKGNYHNWYNFEKNFYMEIYTHFIFDSFVKAYNLYEVNREVLDFYAYYVLNSNIYNVNTSLRETNEMEILTLYKRFFAGSTN